MNHRIQNTGNPAPAERSNESAAQPDLYSGHIDPHPEKRTSQSAIGSIAVPVAGALSMLLIVVLIAARIASAAAPDVALTAAGKPGPGTILAGCPVLPKDNAFNRDISSAPVHPRSRQYIASIGSSTTLHADFGSGRYGDYGIPFRVVGKKQRKSRSGSRPTVRRAIGVHIRSP